MVSVTRKIVEGTALVTSSRILTTILNFIVFVLIVRLLGIHEYGLIVLVLATIGIASNFLDFGIGSVITSDVSRERSAKRFDRAKSLLYRYFQLEIFLGVSLFLIVFLSNTFFEQNYSELVGGLVKISAFLLLTKSWKRIFTTTFNSHVDFRAAFLLETGESFFKCVYLIFLGYYLNLGIYGVMLIYPLSLMSSILFTLPNYIKIVKGYFSVPRLKEHVFFETIKSHGKWATFIPPVKNIVTFIPPWIIQSILGVGGVAVFNVAKKPLLYLNSLVSPMEKVFMPVFPQEIHNVKTVKKMINKSVKYSTWLSLSIVIVSLITAPFVFNYLFGSMYENSIIIFQILVFSILIYPLNLNIRPLFYALKKQKQLFIMTIISSVTFLLLCFSLTFFFGLYGTALLFIINSLIAFWLKYRYMKKINLKIDFREIRRLDDYDKNLFKKIINKLLKRVGISK